MLRDILTARILSRVWPAYTVPWPNADYPLLVCVDSPAGHLTWRAAADEVDLFAELPQRQRGKEMPLDRTEVLHNLAVNGWPESL